MGRKEEILKYCERMNTALTVKQIVNALYPDKTQPYLNQQVTELVQEKKLVRNDEVRPYTVRLSKDGEIISEVRDYSRQGGCTNNRMSKREDIPTPCVTDAEKYIQGWDKLEKYRLQERALDKLFFQAFPKNNSIEEILVKVACLNEFYSTNIMSVYPVAKHILELDIDKRLISGDSSLVGDIALLTREDGSQINNYSFATKYCSHHQPEKYAIYDSYVDSVLKYFRDIDEFAKFARNDLRNYSTFLEVLIKFRKYYGLEKYDLKLLDRYIWQLGKEKFPQNYK